MCARELEDRYGEPPPAVRNLLDYAIAEAAVRARGRERDRAQARPVSIKFRQNAAVDPERLARFVSSQRGAQFTPDGMLKFVLKATAAEEVLRALRTILEQLAAEEAASEVRSAASQERSQ